MTSRLPLRLTQVAIGFLALEGFCFLVLWAVGQDPGLGWTNIGEANSAGMRHGQEYEKLPRVSVLRIESYGDSLRIGNSKALFAFEKTHYAK